MLMKKIVGYTTIAPAFFLGMSMALAAGGTIKVNQCGQHMDVLKYHYDEYGELPGLTGKTAGGETIRVLINPDTRSWSIIITDPKQAVSCLVIGGEDLRPTRGN